jgi:Tat protein secretion system quality control protein TatD with DNase activity
MKFVDAHVHLSDSEYSDKISQIVEDTKRSNVVALISNSMDLETSYKSLQLAKENPNFVYAAIGVHPWKPKPKTKRNRRNNKFDNQRSKRRKNSCHWRNWFRPSIREKRGTTKTTTENFPQNAFNSRKNFFVNYHSF